jgi:hypothetical protein
MDWSDCLIAFGLIAVAMMYYYQNVINKLQTAHNKALGECQRKLLHEGKFSFRDVDHPLKEEEYNKDLKAGIYNDAQAVLNAEHYLRVGPKAGDGTVERSLVPGGGSVVRLWTSPALNRRTALQLENMRLFNDGPTKWKIPVETFRRARGVMERFIFPNEVYVDVAATLLGRKSATAGYVDKKIVSAIIQFAEANKS